MKTSLSIFMLCLAVCSNAQINQKTIELRKQYTKISTYQLRFNHIPASLRYSFLYKEKPAVVPSFISTENLPKPSTHSIQQAFTYYNSLKKPVDLSGVLIVGYSLLSNQQFIINNTPEESVRFFPANAKD